MDGDMDMMTRLLPDDVIAAVLARLAPRSLAASRCVCRAWRAVVDTRRLLRADLLPLSVGGVYLDVSYCGFPPLFYRPSTAWPAAIRDDLDYLGATADDVARFWSIQDHCNGLLLFPDHVLNPATRQCVRLPPRPPQASGDDGLYHLQYLVFDPTVSPHYQVFLIPAIDYEEGSEWPPSSYTMCVFSSRTWQWKERTFVREGPTAASGTVDTVCRHGNRYGVYWRETLYMQCEYNFVLRINLSTGKYLLIEPPAFDGLLHLGKSEKGVYYANTLYGSWLQVWFLDESCGQIEWVSKCDWHLQPMRACRSHDEQVNGPWLLHCYNEDKYYEVQDDYYTNEDSSIPWPSDQGPIACPSDGDIGNSDDDVVGTQSLFALSPKKAAWPRQQFQALNFFTLGLDDAAWPASCLADSNQTSPQYMCDRDEDYRNKILVENMEAKKKEIFEGGYGNDDTPYSKDEDEFYFGSLQFLGFHPFEQVVFLNDTHERVLAYHLDNSRIEDLGSLILKSKLSDIYTSFVYTPCWMGELPCK